MVEQPMPQDDQGTAQEQPIEFETVNVGAGSFQIQRGASQKAIQAAISDYMQTPEFYSGVDRTRGAPFAWRKAVGDALRYEDKLATLRKMAPDAMPFDDDNFVYTDQETKRVTLFNPKGLDLGDIPGAAREISIGIGATLGGMFGGAGGTIAGIPLGPGALATGAGGVAKGAGWGAAITASLYDFLASQFGETQRSEGVIERTAENVMQGLGAAAGQRAFEVAVPAAITGVKVVLGGGTAKAQAMYNRLVSHGITPTAGAVTSGRGAGRIESALDQAAASATTMRNQIESVVSSSQNAASNIATKLGAPRSQQAIGAQMQRAAQSAIERFKIQQSALESDLAKKIGDDALFSIDAVRGFYDEMLQFGKTMPGFSQKAYGSVKEILETLIDDAAVNGGRIPYSAFREVRTFFGGKMSDMSEGVNRSVYKRLYAAMTDDLKFGADAHNLGGMFDDTVAFTRNFKTEFDDVLNKLVDLDAPERGYRFLMNSRRDGGTFFQKMRDQFTDDEWGDVSATIIQKMGFKNFGNEADDAFSVNTFLTNWNSISDEAKQTLFSQIKGGKAARQSLDELVSVFQSMSQSTRLGNFSNTAGAVHTLQLMDALGSDATKLVLGGLAISGSPGLAAAGLSATIMGKVVTPIAAAKLITHPAFVKWLAEGPAVQTGAGVGRHIGRLLAIAEANPEIREQIHEFSDKLSHVDEGGEQ